MRKRAALISVCEEAVVLSPTVAIAGGSGLSVKIGAGPDEHPVRNIPPSSIPHSHPCRLNNVQINFMSFYPD